MNNIRLTQEKSAKSYHFGKWWLNLYIIQYDESEKISSEVCDNIIQSCLTNLEEKCISDEFQYFRIGFAFLHFGRRGINLSIWHIGNWGDTLELWSCVWYTYNREITKMELLDSAEPVLSQYEISILIKELRKIDSYRGDVTNRDGFKEFFFS